MAFSRTMSQGPDPRSPSETGGYGFALFLFGAPDSGSIVHRRARTIRARYPGAYGQDDFKVSKNLTLNMGLRLEINTGNLECYDRMSVNDLTGANTCVRQMGFTVNGGYVFAGSTLGRRALVDPQYNWSPRIGLAYQLDQKTTMRVGYGVFFGVAPYAATTRYVGGAFSSTSPMVASSLDGITPKDTLKNPFPTFNWVLPTGTSLGLLDGNRQTPNSAVPSDMNGRHNQQWNLSIQLQLSGSTIFRLPIPATKARA